METSILIWNGAEVFVLHTYKTGMLPVSELLKNIPSGVALNIMFEEGHLTDVEAHKAIQKFLTTIN